LPHHHNLLDVITPSSDRYPALPASHTWDAVEATSCCFLSAVQLLLAPLICLLAAAAEASEARQVMSALQAVPPQLLVMQQQQQQQHTQQQQQQQPVSGHSAANSLAVAAFAPAVSVPLTLGLQYTNSGILTAVTLLMTAVLWPSCLNLVYTLVICWGLACWGFGSVKTWTTAPLVMLLQAFTGLHIVLLYLAQLPVLQLPQLDLVYDVLGLYSLFDSAAAGRAILLTKIIHLIGLHLLYVHLGLYIGLLRQPIYQKLAAAVKNLAQQQRQQQQWQQQQQHVARQQGSQGDNRGMLVNKARQPNGSSAAELMQPLLLPEQQQLQQQEGQQQEDQEETRLTGPRLQPLQLQQQQQQAGSAAGGAVPADAASAAAANFAGGVTAAGASAADMPEGQGQQQPAGAVRAGRHSAAALSEVSQPLPEAPSRTSSITTTAVPAADSPSVASSIQLARQGVQSQQQQQQQQQQPHPSSSMSPFLPVTGLRGMIERQQQDWAPIQRFIDGSVGTEQLLPVKQQGHDGIVSQPSNRQLRTSASFAVEPDAGQAPSVHQWQQFIDEPQPGGDSPEPLVAPAAATAAAAAAATPGAAAAGSRSRDSAGAVSSTVAPPAVGFQSGFGSDDLSRGFDSSGADSGLLLGAAPSAAAAAGGGGGRITPGSAAAAGGGERSVAGGAVSRWEQVAVLMQVGLV
jgi:hypothetical protein